MNEPPIEASDSAPPEPLDYQPKPPTQNRGSRVGYVISAGICWFGVSLMTFAAVGLGIGPRTVPHSIGDDVSVLMMIVFDILFLLPAIYFTQMAL